MIYFVRNMVSDSCKMIIGEELKNLKIQYSGISLGEIEIPGKISEEHFEVLQKSIKNLGYEVIQDKKLVLTEKIKITIIEMVHYHNEFPNINFSAYLSKKLDYHYTHMANVFSEVYGSTIEHYLIAQKVEKAKKLIVHQNLNLKEIAFVLNYSSVAHLSNQFKKVTGLRPSEFRKINKIGDALPS